MTKYGFMFMLALVVSAGGYSPSQAQTIRLAGIDYCPHQCISQNENGLHGYLREIAISIFEAEGYKIRIETMPFKRAVVETEQGDYDAILSVNSKHSDKLILSKEKSAVLRQYFYVKKGESWRYDGVDSLENVTLGSIVGYNYSPFSPEYQSYLQSNQGSQKVQVIGGDNAPLLNFKKILVGRITTFNEDAALFGFITMKAGITDQFDVAGSLGNNDQYMGFSPKHPMARQLAYVYDKGIRELRKTGQLQLILDRYGVEDWEE